MGKPKNRRPGENSRVNRGGQNGVIVGAYLKNKKQGLGRLTAEYSGINSLRFVFYG